MYSMILDSVRAKSADNQVMAEVSLMRAALHGTPVVLSPNQAMDSIAVQEIIIGNNKRGFQNNYFCTAVRNGIVQVAIPSGTRDLIEYCQSALGRGATNPSQEFLLSGLKFLYAKDASGKDVYPYETRKELTTCIIARLSEAKRVHKTPLPGWLTPSEREMVENYIDSVILLNEAVTEYASYVSSRQNYPKILETLLTNRLLREEPNSPLAILLNLMLSECGKKDASIYRSYYYRVIDQRSGEFPAEAVSEVRTIIDIAYNKLAAMSVQPLGTQGCVVPHAPSGSVEMNIPQQFGDLTDSILQSEGGDCALQTSYTPNQDVSAFDWEMIVWIYQELHILEREKGLNHWEAIKCLYQREKKLPMSLSGKYMIVTGIKLAISSFIPGIKTVEFLAQLVGNEVESAVGEKRMGPGSFREIKERAAISNKALKVLDTLVYSQSKQS